MKDIDEIRRDNLRLLEHECGGPAAAAARVGMSPAQFANLRDGAKDSKTGKPRGMRKETARRIDAAFGKAEGWLDIDHNSAPDDLSKKSHIVGMIGDWYESTEVSLDEGDLPNPTPDEFAFVPQLDIAAACGNGRFEDHVVVKGGLAFKKSFLREQGVPEHAARIIYSDGGSMRPTIQDGRVVLINMAETNPIDNKIYAICLPDGGLVLKRLVRDYHPSAGTLVWILRSDNPDKMSFPDKLLPPDDRTMIAGRAVWTDSLL
jgi:phage repressor protein C with HTH and peptisase S24 domain